MSILIQQCVLHVRSTESYAMRHDDLSVLTSKMSIRKGRVHLTGAATTDIKTSLNLKYLNPSMFI